MIEDSKFEALRAIARACYLNSVAKGWHPEKTLFEQMKSVYQNGVLTNDERGTLQKVLSLMDRAQAQGVPVLEKLALITSEVAEAMEVYRNCKSGSLREYTIGENGKPEGFGSELADIVIRVFDLAEALGIDIADEIQMKMKFNATRPSRHGGKLA